MVATACFLCRGILVFRDCKSPTAQNPCRVSTRYQLNCEMKEVNLHTSREIGLVPPLPQMRRYQSPEVVRVLDRVRRELDYRDGFEEFCWFAREYPRCYRCHLDGADFRLGTMHKSLNSIRQQLAMRAIAANSQTFEIAIGNHLVNRLYWDFESYLSEINIALDLLARVVGPAFQQQSPLSFNNLCKRSEPHMILDLFQSAQRRWVSRLKDYRDCFVHYTPVDTLLQVTMQRCATGWELRAKLPTNPNIREILGFRYSRRIELMRYAIIVHRHMTAFDRVVAKALMKLYRKGAFPVRTEHLFFVGRRSG